MNLRPTRRGMALGALGAVSAVAARAASPGGERLPITLPGLGHVVCRVSIDGIAASAVIDTGASSTTLSPSLARRLGLHVSAGRTLAGIGRDVTGGSTGALTLHLGSTALRLERADIVDLSPLRVSEGFEVDLIIGSELFDGRSVGFDFQHGWMRLDPPGSPPSGAGWARLPLSRSPQGRMTTVIAVDGCSMPAQIDLGSDAPVYLSATAHHACAALVRRPASQAVSVGVDGVSLDRILTARAVRLARWDLEQAPLRVPAAWRADVPAIIGLPILRRFELGVSVPTSELWVRPASALAQPFRKDRSGINAGWTGDRLQVAFVAPDSPAEEAGLRAGDVVASVNGVKADAAFVSRGVRVGSAAAGSKVVLQLQDGRRLTIVLRDYY